MHDLVKSVERTIAARGLLRRGQPVVVAVSGGLDSMVLLQVLHSVSSRNRWRLVVAHFNHGLRGDESDADEHFVRRAAAGLGLRFAQGGADTAAHSRRDKVSVEMAARGLRHGFLAGTARRLNIQTVALAHHADDRVESFFLRLMRGAGGAGLAGMKWSSPSPNDPSVRLIRPLLELSRTELRRFAGDHGVVFREDATNAKHEFLRNRIRNKLLPLLSREYQPAITATVLRTLEIVGADADYVREAAEDWMRRKRRDDFEQLHLSVQRQVLRIQLFKTGVEPDFDLVEQLRASSTRFVTAAEGVTLYRSPTGQICTRSLSGACFTLTESRVDILRKRGTATFGGLEFDWQISRCVPSAIQRTMFKEGCEYFDADKIVSPIVLRHWRRGDRFQPVGMKVRVKLQDLFANQKIARDQRHQLVVATTASGELFWVEGLRMAEGFKLDNQTLRRLKWRWMGR